MAKITEALIPIIYQISKSVHLGKQTQKQGLDTLENDYGVNRNSAADYIHNYNQMASGKRFTRTLNAYGTEYYLRRFFIEEGPTHLRYGLSSLKKHIEYYEDKRKVMLHELRAIYDRFQGLVDANAHANSGLTFNGSSKAE